jgi:hypothetical protein
MISIDTLVIVAPLVVFVIVAPLAFVEYCFIERAKRREQLAMAGRETLSAPGAAQPANPDSPGTVKNETAAE